MASQDIGQVCQVNILILHMVPLAQETRYQKLAYTGKKIQTLARVTGALRESRKIRNIAATAADFFESLLVFKRVNVLIFSFQIEFSLKKIQTRHLLKDFQNVGTAFRRLIKPGSFLFFVPRNVLFLCGVPPGHVHPFARNVFSSKKQNACISN